MILTHTQLQRWTASRHRGSVQITNNDGARTHQMTQHPRYSHLGFKTTEWISLQSQSQKINQHTNTQDIGSTPSVRGLLGAVYNHLQKEPAITTLRFSQRTEPFSFLRCSLRLWLPLKSQEMI